MLGAIIGDIVGSVWEFRCPPADQDGFRLFPDEAGFTDDTLMTLAIARALMDANGDQALGPVLVADTMRRFASYYRLQRGGYGGGFANWLQSTTPQPYGSAGNGSAMRVSAVGWLYPTLELTEQWAKISAAVTHNDPEGIAGAQATAAAIFLARTGASRDDIQRYVTRRFGYDLDRSWEDVLADDPQGRKPDAILCRRTVPEALAAFLAADSFEATIRRSVAVGGDTDTRAAIAGSIAEAYWGVPDRLCDGPDDEPCDVDPREQVRRRLPEPLRAVLDEFTAKMLKGGTLAAIARRAYRLARITTPDTGSAPVDFVAAAERIATVKHEGATDKAGAPYIGHPRCVAARVRAWGGTDQQIAAAWLHDVVEDTDTTIADLLDAGIPAETVAMVSAVSKQDGEPTARYIDRIVSTPGALLVKRADLADNTDPDRIAVLRQLDPPKADRLKAKYAEFTTLLDAATSST